MGKIFWVVAGATIALSIGCGEDKGSGTATENSGGAPAAGGGGGGSAAGGDDSSGGENAGGESASGGNGTASGGTASGGTSGGGADSGGASAGGASSGGTSSGGTASGGASSGGTASGGAATGGAATGGTSSGGTSSGGAATGGAGQGEPCVGGAHLETQTRTRYSSASVPAGQSCASQQQTRTCNNGQWSAWTGTYTYEACTPSTATTKTVSCLLTRPVTQCSEWKGENLEGIQCPGGTLGEGCSASGVQGICQVTVSGIVSRSFYYSTAGLDGVRTGCTGSGGEWITP